MFSKSKAKKEKKKADKLTEINDSDNDENEHELSYYINDRVRLMKEVLKIIHPKKIKSMAPTCIKNSEIEEINSMLLEELLGISNKRLKCIFNGQNLSEDSSSTDSEEEKNNVVDVISLDDISDDDFITVESDGHKRKEPKQKKIKNEAHNKVKRKREEPLQEEKLMSVLELLELQARARAIRSQLMLEMKQTRQENNTSKHSDSDTDDDAVIIEPQKNEEIIITSSDSENDQICDKDTSNNANEKTDPQNNNVAVKEFKRKNRTNSVESNNLGQVAEHQAKTGETQETSNTASNNVMESPSTSVQNDKQTDKNNKNTQCSDDEIVLIVDQEEIDAITGE